MTIRQQVKDWVDTFKFAKTLHKQSKFAAETEDKVTFIPNVRPQFLRFKDQAPKGELLEPEFNLGVVEKALEAESLFRQARDKYVGLIWKNGYSFNGKDPNTVEYIKTRLEQIAIVTGVPTSVFLDSIAEQLVTYHNVFIARVRDAKSSGGKPYTNIFNKNLNPVSGYFVLDTPRVRAIVNKETKVTIGWKVEATDTNPEQYYLAQDVIHFYMTKRPGKVMGTPLVMPVINDIKALRKMESMSESLVYQHSFPLLVYTAGTEESPVAEEATFEQIRSEVQDADPHGLFVVPFNHAVKAVGMGDNPIDVTKYLEYFRQRIISGLGLSSVAFGESGTSNRSTAIVQDRGLQDGAKKYQTNIRAFFDMLVINELLEEGGFDFMNPEVAVHLFTPEIDIDSKIKKEVHAMAGFHGNVLDIDETRAEWGRDPFTEEQMAKTYWQLIELPSAIIGASDESYTGTNSAGEKVTKQVDPQLKINRALSTRVQPVNQKGAKRDTKPAVNKNSFEDMATQFLSKMDWVFADGADWGESVKTLPEALIAPLWEIHTQGAITAGRPMPSRGDQLSEVFETTQRILGELADDATNSLKGPEAHDLLRRKLITRVAGVMERAYNLGYSKKVSNG